MNQKNDEINLRGELRKVQVQLQHKEEAYKKLSDEKRVLESRTAFLQKSLEQVQEKLQEKETIVKEIQREKERLHHEINEKSQEIHRLNVQNVHLSQGIKEEETRLEKELEIMHKQVDKLQNTNKRLKEQMALFDTRIAYIRRDLNAKDGLIEQMRNQRNQIFKASANLLSYINSELLPQLPPEVQKKIEFNVSDFSNVLHSVAPLKYRVLFHIVSKQEKSTVTELAQKLNEDTKTVRAITEELQARQWINKSDELVYPVGEGKPEPIPPHEWAHLKPTEILNSLADYSKAVADHSKVSQAILKVRNLIAFHPSLSLTLRREALAWAQGKGDIFRLNNLIQQWKQEFQEVEEESIEEEREERVVQESIVEEERVVEAIPAPVLEDKEIEEAIPAPVLADEKVEEELSVSTLEDKKDEKELPVHTIEDESVEEETQDNVIENEDNGE